jgi:hypothetical protein
LRGQFVSAAILTAFRYHTYLIPSGPGFRFNQSTNQLQKRLMLGISPSRAQKFGDIDIGQLAAGWDIGLVPDEHVRSGGIATEKPSVSVRAAVELSLLGGHLWLLSSAEVLHECFPTPERTWTENLGVGYLHPGLIHTL